MDAIDGVMCRTDIVAVRKALESCRRWHERVLSGDVVVRRAGLKTCSSWLRLKTPGVACGEAGRADRGQHTQPAGCWIDSVWWI